MKVVSPAGDFEIKVSDSSVEGDFVVLSGQMGVWDSKIYLTPADIWQFTSIFLQPSIVLFILKMPFRFFFGDSKGDAKKSNGNKINRITGAKPD